MLVLVELEMVILCWHMHSMLRVLVDWAKLVRGGIRVSPDGSGTEKTPQLPIITVDDDDGSLEASISPIRKGHLDGRVGRRPGPTPTG